VRRVVIDQQPYLGRDAEAVAEVFGDHELIASLGCGAVINIPVVDGDRTLGVVNLLNAEGAYDEASVVAAAPLAAVALEPLRAWRAGRAGGRATRGPATRGPGMTSLLVRHARVLDVEAGTYREDYDVLAVDGRVADVGRDLATPEDVAVLDAGGATVVPGLGDAHVHVTAATADLSALPTWAPSYVAAHSGQIMGKMLERGFTTVRDAGGADWGLARAQAEGLICGPRLLFCGKALSQTGGHGDGRSPGRWRTVWTQCGLRRVTSCARAPTTLKLWPLAGWRRRQTGSTRHSTPTRSCARSWRRPTLRTGR
jgi:Amidohydrolase family